MAKDPIIVGGFVEDYITMVPFQSSGVFSICDLAGKPERKTIKTAIQDGCF
ncbi:hypothetical protein [Grimontia marina]|uniref:Uncharacterized protein n=1 Tax=Grimontia marina TaxID=646534 RepID=A0A128EY49_9GAMM|nr:hypothetical protein [Grimontia marina]CZF79502.1 hypothetical protein GMA8713_01004 [Grimontia marina]